MILCISCPIKKLNIHYDIAICKAHFESLCEKDMTNYYDYRVKRNNRDSLQNCDAFYLKIRLPTCSFGDFCGVFPNKPISKHNFRNFVWCWHCLHNFNILTEYKISDCCAHALARLNSLTRAFKFPYSKCLKYH